MHLTGGEKIIHIVNMAEGTYEYECMRAELLGIEKPDYDQFMRDKAENEKKEVEEEEVDTENLKEVDNQKEGMSRISGGLEELNSILKKTQFKINRFKASCGSITGLLRRDSKSDSSTSLHSSSQQEENKATTEDATSEDCSIDRKEDINSQSEVKPRKSDLAKALDNDVDKIDSMVAKAESAQFSMEQQRKQMKKFLK